MTDNQGPNKGQQADTAPAPAARQTGAGQASSAPGLARMQGDWSSYFRQPGVAPRPTGTEPRRIDVYASLLRNNIGSFIHQCFPLCEALIGTSHLEALIDRFFAEGRWHTSPFFHEIPKAFVDFLQAEDAPAGESLPPWLAELAHYEWLELAVETALDVPLRVGPQGLALCPALQLGGYAYPVHTIGAEDAEVVPATTFVAVYRDRQHQVRFNVLTPAAAQLLDALQDNGCDWQAACEQLASHWGLAADVLAEQVAPLQQQWLADELLLRPGTAQSVAAG